MSATPNNTGAGWTGAPSEPEHAGPGLLNDAASGRDALQALLAFASLQEQAARRRAEGPVPARQDDLALDEVLSLVAARALSITGADGVAIALAHDNAIVCRASAGRIALDRGSRLDPNSGFSGACLRTGNIIKCDDSETDKRVNAEACRRLGTRSMIAVPLSAKDRVIGLIEAFSTEAFGFNDSDLNSLNLLSELILAAIRPEEENRMAELAGQLVVPEPTVRPEKNEPIAEPEKSSPASPRVLVDEKFVPSQAKPETKPELAPATELTAVGTETTAEPDSPSVEAPVAPQFELPVQKRSFLGVLLVTILVLVAVGLGWAVYGKIRHAEQSISASTRAEASVKPETTIPEPSLETQTAPPAGTTPQVTGIQHSSSESSSTVVVELQDQVQYEGHSLENPPRIYFDLHDTTLAAALINSNIDVDDNFVKRIRAAQASGGITRVVIETKGDLEFSVRLDPGPYRLTIDIHKPAGHPGTPTSPIPLAKPSPSVEPKKSTSAGVGSASLKIVLDAGHGGWDLGTVGRKGLLEKDLVLDVVARLGSLISEKMGSQIIYTRQDDSYLPLEKRAEIANLAHANLFLSVHANYSDLATARGVETFYTNTYSSIKARTDEATLKDVDWTDVDIRSKVVDSRRLASDVQQSLFAELVARNPEIKNRGVKKAEYVVLTGTQMPAVLAEVSFVSSPADEDKLQNAEYRQQIAEALYRGVAKYFQDVGRIRIAKSVN